MKTIFKIHTLLFISIVILLPGCTTIVNWGKKNLYQGIEFQKDYTIPRSFIRSIKAYDQFSTFIDIHALLLVEAVRNAFVTEFITTTGKGEKQKNQLLKLQKDELKHFITFYVITPKDTVFNLENSPWHIFLTVDKLTVDPYKIEQIELNTTYQLFFGKLYNPRFKTVYQIKFEACDLYDNPLIISTTQAVELHFKKLNKEVLLRWDLLKTNQASSYPDSAKDEKLDTSSRNEHARSRKKSKKAIS
ncbi:MAG TPA: hypothetical protein VL201_00945 [Patescibacteria group bacterium]|nr:hypothetical protein [Patescibacteria group bacterium]